MRNVLFKPAKILFNFFSFVLVGVSGSSCLWQCTTKRCRPHRPLCLLNNIFEIGLFRLPPECSFKLYYLNKYLLQEAIITKQVD